MKHITKLLKHLINTGLVFILTLCTLLLPIAYSQDNECTKVDIKPIEQTGQTGQKSVKIPFSPGNTNNDFTFNNVIPFADLDILESPEQNILSGCIFKNNSARILNIDTQNGFLTLSNSIGITDSVSQNDPGAIRGTCSFSSINKQLFFTGIGPSNLGFDRIYPFNINDGILNRTTEENNIKNFFTPSDLSTSLAATPNGKFLVYIQADTSNNNTASIQSIPIKNMILENSFVGQTLAKTTKAGTYIELIGEPNETFAFGIEGGEKSFAIFKTNQLNGTNLILAEPNLFNSLDFIEYSGFKLIKRNGELYLFISYLENNSTDFLKDINIISKLALFKVEIRSELAKSASLKQIGESTLTLVKFKPCNENKILKISGPIWVENDTLYIAGINEKLITSYFIDWDAITNETKTSKIFKLSSKPITTLERNTDLVLTMDGKFAYVASVSSKESLDVNISGYEIKKSAVSCSDLKNQLLISGICDLENKEPKLISNIPDQIVKINQTVAINLNDHFKDEGDITYTLINNPAPSFTQINESTITINPTSSNQAGIYNITVKAEDKEGLVNTTSFTIEVSIEPNQQASTTSPTPSTTGGTTIFIPPPPSPSSPPPASTGNTAPTKSPSTQPTNTGSIPKPTSSSPSANNNSQPSEIMLEPIPLDLPELPDIELVPVDIGSDEANTSQSIDINSLDLSGPDQIIIFPTIPQITFSNQNLESPEIEIIPDELASSSSGSTIPLGKVTDCCSCATGKLICNENTTAVCDGGTVVCTGVGSMVLACCRGKPATAICNGDDLTIKCVQNKEDTKKKLLNKLTADQLPVETSSTRGVINRGNSGFLISLKANIKLKESDLNNIIHILINNEKKITILTSKTFLVGNNRLLVDLKIPESLNEGSYVLASLLNKGGGKKELLSKGTLKIIHSLNFKNVSPKSNQKVKIELPSVEKINARTIRDFADTGKIIRLTITGKNFASRLIEVNGRLFISKPYTTNTILSFVDSSKVDILKTRVLTRGNKMLVVLRFNGLDITKIPFTISTPKGQFFYNTAKFSVLTNDFERNVILNLDKKKK